MSEELVVYQYPGSGPLLSLSPPCLKVQMALRRLGLPYRVVNLGNPLEVRRISRAGRVPILETQSGRIADSIAILDALEERDTGFVLFPRDSAERARDRLWDLYVTESFYWTGLYLRWMVAENCDRLLDAMLGPGFSFRKLVVRLTLVPGMRRRARGQGIGRRSRAEVERAVGRGLRMIDQGLESGPFLGGRSTPGRGDLAVVAHLAQAGWKGTLPDALGRVRAHPALVEHLRSTFESCGLQPPEPYLPHASDSAGAV